MKETKQTYHPFGRFQFQRSRGQEIGDPQSHIQRNNHDDNLN